MKNVATVAVLAVAFSFTTSSIIFPSNVIADEAMIELEAPDDPMQVLLSKYKGKKVSIVLSSGTEIGGTLVDVTFDTVSLKEVTGKEVFDAAIRTDQVAAVYLRRETPAK